METKKIAHPFIFLLLIIMFSVVWAPVTIASDTNNLDEASVKAYLEKKAIEDPGSCLVENTKMEIIGIADLVPGQQSEVYYKFEYLLRCNRSKKTKSGQGILKAARLRNGQWIDREMAAIISK